MARTDNSFTRAQLRARTKNGIVGAPAELTIDDHLTRLEEDLRRLKIEFDIFFNGALRKPPYDIKNKVDTTIKRLSDDRTLNYAERFRLNALCTRYNAFSDLWRRTMKGREEGRDPGATARASAKQQAAAEFQRTEFLCTDAHKDVELVKNIYSALVEAKKLCGEPVDDFSFPRFHRLVASRADGLKERLGCDQVSFSIDVEGGHVSFKAKGERM